MVMMTHARDCTTPIPAPHAESGTRLRLAGSATPRQVIPALSLSLSLSLG